MTQPLPAYWLLGGAMGIAGVHAGVIPATPEAAMALAIGSAVVSIGHELLKVDLA